ncbi:acetylserotonin O-methyltransferase [Petromyzon marinus]|uniref:acetylserotonin O-methyltransferase n=1 Tax=Petromyzon marinus TaxID=7757 RepID=UPI003F70BD92
MDNQDSVKVAPSTDLDFPSQILEYIEGFRKSKAMFTACELGVFDFLESPEGRTGATVEAVAGALDGAGPTSVDGLGRLLDACVGMGLLNISVRGDQFVYSNTEQASAFLCRHSPKSMHDIIIYNSATIYPLWQHLPAAVLEGQNQYEKTFGVSNADLFGAMYRSDDEMMKFMKLMNGIWAVNGHAVLTAFDLSPFKDVYDLGGCTGALALQLAEIHPDSRVTVFDLPPVVEVARKHFLASGTVQLQGGDFFKDEIPQGDLYILARILHDWSKEQCMQLLGSIYSSCRPGGGLLVVECLLAEDRRGPISVQLYSLNMLVQTEGRERFASEYTAMLTEVGFRDIRVANTGKLYNAILGRK